jgi:hypothetical protein
MPLSRIFTFPIDIQSFHGMAQMGDDDTAVNDQGDIEGIIQFFIRPPRVHALDDVIINAIIAAQYHRSNQTQQFFGFSIQSTVLISICIQVEETLNPQMLYIGDTIIHFTAVCLKFFQSIRHNHHFQNRSYLIINDPLAGWSLSMYQPIKSKQGSC